VADAGAWSVIRARPLDDGVSGRGEGVIDALASYWSPMSSMEVWLREGAQPAADPVPTYRSITRCLRPHGRETPAQAPDPTGVVTETGLQPGPMGWTKS
jgi:hypothetical protein